MYHLYSRFFGVRFGVRSYQPRCPCGYSVSVTCLLVQSMLFFSRQSSTVGPFNQKADDHELVLFNTGRVVFFVAMRDSPRYITNSSMVKCLQCLGKKKGIGGVLTACLWFVQGISRLPAAYYAEQPLGLGSREPTAAIEKAVDRNAI